MHESQLARSTYAQPATTTDAETGVADSGGYFQDCEISTETVLDGTLVQRFDKIAFPQKGVKYTGTDSDGNPVPAPAKSVR